MSENVGKPGKRKALTAAEVREAFEPLGGQYPPILNLEQAAALSGYTPLTLKKKLSEGCFRDCVARGKPVLFWRDRFVLDLMNRKWLSAARPNHEQGSDEAHVVDGGDHETH